MFKHSVLNAYYENIKFEIYVNNHNILSRYIGYID